MGLAGYTPGRDDADMPEQELHALLRVFRQIGRIVECHAQDCFREGRSELVELVRLLEADPDYRIDDVQAVCRQLQRGLAQSEARERLWHVIYVSDKLWERLHGPRPPHSLDGIRDAVAAGARVTVSISIRDKAG